jgi:uncharacterized protein (UPF0332 family)
MSDSLSSFEWIQFLDLAEDLLNSANKDKDLSLAEAKYRTVIGRAYYAAFNVAKEYLESQGTSLSRNGGAHKKVREHFDNQNQQNESSSIVADNLNNLRRSRNFADYEKKLHKTIDWKNQSESAIEVANEVINAIKAIELLDKKEKQQDKPGLKEKPRLKPKK